MSLRSFSLFVSLFVSTALTGCLGDGMRAPVGGVSGGPGESGAVFGAAPEEKGDIAVDMAEAQPQAGGISAPIAEHEDDVSYWAQGSAEPVCRQENNRIKYRLKGHVERKPEPDSVNVGGCHWGKLTVSFWNGQSCDTHVVELEACGFDLMIVSSEAPVYHIYQQGVAKLDIDPNTGPLSADEESQDGVSAPIAGIDPSKLASPLKETANLASACTLQGELLIENKLVSFPIEEPLPECSNTKLKKVPIKGGIF